MTLRRRQVRAAVSDPRRVEARGVLPAISGENDAFLRHMHGSTLLGMVLPVVGHLLPIWLAKRHANANARTSVLARRHLSASWDFHLFWGSLIGVSYAMLVWLGISILPLTLLIVLTWAIQVGVVVARLEGGHSARFYFYY